MKINVPAWWRCECGAGRDIPVPEDLSPLERFRLAAAELNRHRHDGCVAVPAGGGS